MGARARGSVANGLLGCESGGEGFVERGWREWVAGRPPDEELARDWPVSQPSSGGQWRAVVGRPTTGETVPVGLRGWPFGLGDERAWLRCRCRMQRNAEKVQRRGLRDSQMVVRGWPQRPTWARPALCCTLPVVAQRVLASGGAVIGLGGLGRGAIACQRCTGAGAECFCSPRMRLSEISVEPDKYLTSPQSSFARAAVPGETQRAGLGTELSQEGGEEGGARLF